MAVRCLCVVLLLAVLAPFSTASGGEGDAVAFALREVLTKSDSDVKAGNHVVPTDAVRALYEERLFAPLWIENGRISARGAAFAAAAAKAADEGLDPTLYALPVPPRDGSAVDIARSELAATATVLRYLLDLRIGSVSPRKVDPDQFIVPAAVDSAAVARALAAAPDLAGFLSEQAPASAGYRGLRQALKAQRSMAAAGPWPKLDGTPKLQAGVSSPSVATLRQLLHRSGDHSGDLKGHRFDADLAKAVVRFQERHGLQADGVVGPQTMAALNRGPEERIRQIIVNMERWRWMPSHPGEMHVLVNMAGYDLDLMEHGAPALSMRVVVGKPFRQTPAFNARIESIDFNPYWNVPHSIAVKDIVPIARNNPGYLVSRRIRVFGAGGEVDPYMVDWDYMGPDYMPFRLRQDPGPRNSLGRIRFDLPNRFAVYLHDTPSRELFQRTVRTYSSGCIRVEKPVELALRLLQGKSEWTEDRIRRAIDKGGPQSVRLQRPIPIYINYFTTWRTADGTDHFRDDVYGRDALLVKALFTTRERELADSRR